MVERMELEGRRRPKSSQAARSPGQEAAEGLPVGARQQARLRHAAGELGQALLQLDGEGHEALGVDWIGLDTGEL